MKIRVWIIIIFLALIILIGIISLFPKKQDKESNSNLKKTSENIPPFEITYSLTNGYSGWDSDLYISYNNTGISTYREYSYLKNYSFENKTQISQEEANSLYQFFNSEFLKINETYIGGSCVNDSTSADVVFKEGSTEKRVMFDTSCNKPLIIPELMKRYKEIKERLKSH